MSGAGSPETGANVLLDLLEGVGGNVLAFIGIPEQISDSVCEYHPRGELASHSLSHLRGKGIVRHSTQRRCPVEEVGLERAMQHVIRSAGSSPHRIGPAGRDAFVEHAAGIRACLEKPKVKTTQDAGLCLTLRLEHPFLPSFSRACHRAAANSPDRRERRTVALLCSFDTFSWRRLAEASFCCGLPLCQHAGQREQISQQRLGEAADGLQFLSIDALNIMQSAVPDITNEVRPFRQRHSDEAAFAHHRDTVSEHPFVGKIRGKQLRSDVQRPTECSGGHFAQAFIGVRFLRRFIGPQHSRGEVTRDRRRRAIWPSTCDRPLGITDISIAGIDPHMRISFSLASEVFKLCCTRNFALTTSEPDQMLHRRFAISNDVERDPGRLATGTTMDDDRHA